MRDIARIKQEIKRNHERSDQELMQMKIVLEEKQHLLKNADVQNDNLKRDLDDLQRVYQKQKDHYEPELDRGFEEINKLKQLISDGQLQLKELTRPAKLNKHFIEKRLHCQIRDLKDELFEAKR